MTQSRTQSWARGGLIFAGVMMLIIGIYEILIGIAAIAKNQFFVVAQGYAYSINTTVWGWVHLGIGVLAVIAGLFVFTGAIWARAIGIAMAVVSAIANFFFLPYYPLWSIVLIALDAFVIWALATARVQPQGWTGQQQEEVGYQPAHGAQMAGARSPEEGGSWPMNPPSTGRGEPPKTTPGREPSTTGRESGSGTEEQMPTSSSGQNRPPGNG